MQLTSRTPLAISRYVVALLGFCLASIPASGFAQSATPSAATQAVDVDCGADDSLSDALSQHGDGTTFQVSGTCMERVSITHDDVTIDGGGTAIIDAANQPDGPVVHVTGARNVTLRGITVQNGQHGILVEQLSTITLDGIVSRDNTSHGVEIIQSHATATGLGSHHNGRVGLIVNRSSEVRLVDSSLESNGISGLVIFSSAIGRLEGTNIIRDNAAQGVTLGLNGMIFSIGAELIIEDNGSDGLYLLQNGAAQFLGGTITVRGNDGSGISLDIGSSLTLGMGDFEVPGEVLVEENAGHGISVAGGSHLMIDTIMPATVQSNMGNGLHVDASDVTMARSVIEGNDGAELELVFGARATIENMTLDEIVCGEAVLVRGAASCP